MLHPFKSCKRIKEGKSEERFTTKKSNRAFNKGDMQTKIYVLLFEILKFSEYVYKSFALSRGSAFIKSSKKQNKQYKKINK